MGSHEFTTRRVIRRDEAAPALSAALAPVIARALEVGGGPQGGEFRLVEPIQP